MKKLLSQPLFWSNVVSIMITGLVVGGVAFAWNNPGLAPVGGSGAISADAAKNVTIGGNVSWSGFTLTGGIVPWARLSGIPGPCGAGQFVRDMSTGACGAATVSWGSVSGSSGSCAVGQYVTGFNGSTPVCSAPSSGGGITGSGTSGNITMWTGATSVGNLSGPVTFPGDIVVNSNSWGSSSGNIAGASGTASFSLWGGPSSWTATCPAGSYVMAIGQNGNPPGGLANPFIICAKL